MSDNIEENFPKSRIHSFLKDIILLCRKHKACIYTVIEEGKRPSTVVNFDNWEVLEELEADASEATVYWPRIETHLMHEEKP